MTASDTSITAGNWAPSAFALFLVQVILILVLSRVLGWFLKFLKMPAVVAEMLAGILIGPTALGRVPGFTDNLFPASSVNIITVIANFGLVFFLFIVGLELDPAKLRADISLSAFISFSGIFFPLVASLLLAIPLYSDSTYTSSANYGIMSLFLTCTLGISALPVLARILTERRMLQTRIVSYLCRITLTWNAHWKAALEDCCHGSATGSTLAVRHRRSPGSTLWHWYGGELLEVLLLVPAIGRTALLVVGGYCYNPSYNCQHRRHRPLPHSESYRSPPSLPPPRRAL